VMIDRIKGKVDNYCTTVESNMLWNPAIGVLLNEGWNPVFEDLAAELEGDKG